MKKSQALGVELAEVKRQVALIQAARARRRPEIELPAVVEEKALKRGFWERLKSWGAK